MIVTKKPEYILTDITKASMQSGLSVLQLRALVHARELPPLGSFMQYTTIDIAAIHEWIKDNPLLFKKMTGGIPKRSQRSALYTHLKGL